MIELCVVMTTYEQFQYSLKALESLRTSFPPLEKPEYIVVVVDDASSNWTSEVSDKFRNVLPARSVIKHFDVQEGVTRGWNYGLKVAKDFKCEYTVICNDDVIFPIGWWSQLKQGLSSHHLVGPITNAPGSAVHYAQQNLTNYIKDYEPSDDPYQVTLVNEELQTYAGELIDAEISGFFMAAKTDVWWANAFSQVGDCVFDPDFPMLGNDVEFQDRFNGKIGICKSCFIFHYKGISRRDTASPVVLKTQHRVERICLYTAIFGDYDFPRMHNFGNVDYTIFTDNHRLDVPYATIKVIKTKNPRLTARKLKVLSHKIFPNHKYSVWVDGNIQLMSHPGELAKFYLERSDMAAFRHPTRGCTYQEADTCKYLELDDKDVITRQVERYKKEGLGVAEGMLETSVIVRRHNNSVKNFNELWWNELKHGSERDQISVMYAIGCSGLRYSYLPGSRMSSPICVAFPHKRQHVKITWGR